MVEALYEYFFIIIQSEKIRLEKFEERKRVLEKGRIKKMLKKPYSSTSSNFLKKTAINEISDFSVFDLVKGDSFENKNIANFLT